MKESSLQPAIDALEKAVKDASFDIRAGRDDGTKSATVRACQNAATLLLLAATWFDEGDDKQPGVTV